MKKPVVLITGGASGIGWASAVSFAANGWFVVVADKNESQAARQVAAHPDSMESVALDVASLEVVERVFAEVYARHGKLHALVNSAGIQQWTSLSNIDWAAWSAVLDINLNGTARCLQAAGRRMAADGGGAIVNLSSIAEERGVIGRSPYTVSKAGVVALTRCAAMEWALKGVRVNAVAPGYVATEMVEEYVSSGKLEIAPILARIPLNRLAAPAEIANVIRFLCSEESSYITGQVLVADGGFLTEYGIPPNKPENAQ